MGLWELWVKRTHFIELTINSYSHRLSAFALGHLDIRNIRAKGEEVAIGQQEKKNIYIYIYNLLGAICHVSCVSNGSYREVEPVTYSHIHIQIYDKK